MSATEKRACCQCLIKQSDEPVRSHDEIEKTKRALKRYVKKQLQKIEIANKEPPMENPDQLLNKSDPISKRISICLCGTLYTILYYITGCFIIRAICCKRKHDDVDSDSEIDSEDEDNSKTTWRGKIKTILLCLSGYWLFRKCSDYCCAICKSGSKQLFWKIVGWGIFAIFICVIVFSRYFRLLGYLVVEGFFSLLSILMRFTGGIPIDGTIDTVVIQTLTVYDDLAGNSNSIGNNTTLAPSMPLQRQNSRLRKNFKPTSRPTSSTPVLSPTLSTASPSMSPLLGSQAPTPPPSIMQIYMLQPPLTTAPTSASAIKSASSSPPTINVLDFYRMVESHVTQAPSKN